MPQMARLAFLILFIAALSAMDTRADTPELVAGLTSQKTVYGDVIADARGMTLYQSNADVVGKSNCSGGCTEVWQPLAAPRIAKPSGDWSIVERDDGTVQWALKGKPLYLYAGDHAPGDVNGNASEGRWRAAMVAPAFLPVGVSIRPTEYGPSFATEDGRVLYMMVKFFYNVGANGTPRHQSSPAPSECVGDCAQSWKPLIAKTDATANGDWSLVAHDDGTRQWAWKSHPLYTYAREAKPGDTTGEGNWVYIGNVGTHWEVANIIQ